MTLFTLSADALQAKQAAVLNKLAAQRRRLGIAAGELRQPAAGFSKGGLLYAAVKRYKWLAMGLTGLGLAGVLARPPLAKALRLAFAWRFLLPKALHWLASRRTTHGNLR